MNMFATNLVEDLQSSFEKRYSENYDIESETTMGKLYNVYKNTRKMFEPSGTTPPAPPVFIEQDVPHPNEAAPPPSSPPVIIEELTENEIVLEDNYTLFLQGLRPLQLI